MLVILILHQAPEYLEGNLKIKKKKKKQLADELKLNVGKSLMDIYSTC